MDRLEQRRQQVVRNEKIFRGENRQQAEVLVHEHGWDPDLGGVQFHCECGHATCRERIVMRLDEYAEEHRDPAWFIVRAGHELPEFERVVRQTERWGGNGARTAVAPDPLLLPAFTRFDLALFYRLDEHTDFSLNFENLFDELIFVSGSVGSALEVAAPRNVTFRMGYRF